MNQSSHPIYDSSIKVPLDDYIKGMVNADHFQGEGGGKDREKLLQILKFLIDHEMTIQGKEKLVLIDKIKHIKARKEKCLGGKEYYDNRSTLYEKGIEILNVVRNRGGWKRLRYSEKESFQKHIREIEIGLRRLSKK